MNAYVVLLWYILWTGLATWLASQYNAWLNNQDDETFIIPSSILFSFGVAIIEVMRIVRSVPLVLFLCRQFIEADPFAVLLVFITEFMMSSITGYGPPGQVMIRGNLRRECRRRVSKRLEQADG